ncbi:hypothetical protein GJV07_00640 [Enterobacteriaceae bacterium RIT711]|nr:hypothetical protein [Enterobacteriaceae bacterium RIT711]
MSQTVITSAFDALKAQQSVNNTPVILDGFVFANVPGLNITDPIDPAEAMPSAAQIVHRADVAKTGVVNENGVVYSVTLGADIGDFEFNWVGLINKASNTLAMIVHAPAQQKVKNAAGKQGNVLTRSFLMQYDGAQAQTEITTPAQTWQIDFTARLAGMDERVRVENIDVYGAAAFLGNGFLVTKSGNNYAVTAGAGYVGGLRGSLAADKALTVATKPMKVWADVSWKGTLTSVWQTTVDIQLNAALIDYVKDGIQHYVCAIAQINADGTVTDLRPKGPLSQQQATSDYLRKDKNLGDVADKAATRNNIGLKGAAVLDVGTAAGTVAAGNDPRIVNAVPNTRKINGHALSADASLTAGDVGALSSGGGRITGNVEMYSPTPTIQLTDTDTGKKFFIFSFKSGFRINEDSASGNSILLYNDGSKILSSVGQIVPGNYANFDAKYQPKGSYTPAGEAYTKAVSDGRFQPKGSYTPAGEAYTKAQSDAAYAPKTSVYTKTEGDGRYALADSLSYAGFVSNDAANPYFRHKSSNTVINLATRTYTYSKTESDARFQAKGSYTPAGEAYTKAVSDGRFQPKGSYTPAGEAYTKAVSDGRYPLKTATVTQIRLGAQTQHGNGDYLATFIAASTRVFTGKGSESGQGDGRRVWWYTRPLQVLINGAWVAAAANG